MKKKHKYVSFTVEALGFITWIALLIAFGAVIRLNLFANPVFVLLRKHVYVIQKPMSRFVNFAFQFTQWEFYP